MWLPFLERLSCFYFKASSASRPDSGCAGAETGASRVCRPRALWAPNRLRAFLPSHARRCGAARGAGPSGRLRRLSPAALLLRAGQRFGGKAPRPRSRRLPGRAGACVPGRRLLRDALAWQLSPRPASPLSVSPRYSRPRRPCPSSGRRLRRVVSRLGDEGPAQSHARCLSASRLAGPRLVVLAAVCGPRARTSEEQREVCASRAAGQQVAAATAGPCCGGDGCHSGKRW